MADYQFIAETLRRMGRMPKRRNAAKKGETSAKVGAAARVLLKERGELSYFSLHKLLFLAEVRHLEANSERLTAGYYVRQKDGPYCVELHASRFPELIPGCHLRSHRGKLMISWHVDLLDEPRDPLLSDLEVKTLEAVAAKYGNLSAAKLKTATYLSAPMRDLLRKEKVGRLNLFNSALLPHPSPTILID